MSDSEQAAAPESGRSDTPSFAELAADPEIAPLLVFEPAPRKVERPDGWTLELQRELIARIAHLGSPGKACDAMDKNLSGAKHLYRTEGADSFRAAWQAAIALAAARRRAERAAAPPRPVDVPGIGRPRSGPAQEGPLPGQVLNEHGEWEDEASCLRRAEDAKDSIGNKLIRIRRLYLQEISDSPGKRAAFEILTGLPIDWEIAARGEPQPDEPWKSVNQRQPDMILTAESGWSFGEIGYGPDRKAELRKAIDKYRAEQGLEPVEWEGESTESSEQARSLSG
jgi:hypothetical protein